METIENLSNIEVAKHKQLWARLTKANRLFLLTVALPTIAATLYYGLFASDIFVSESRFVVRSPQRQAQTGVFDALLQGTGFSKAEDDAYSVIDYMQSRDALAELNSGKYILEAYGEHGDILSRFGKYPNGSFESLWKYYGKRVVDVNLDPVSGITTLKVQAFSAYDAEKINEMLLEMSERLVNRMNARATDDLVRFSRRQVEMAENNAKNAAAALAVYRNTHVVFDPEKQSALLLQQASNLQAQLLEMRAQLSQLQSVAPQNPQIGTLKINIANLETQVREATGDVTGSENSLANKTVQYARLQLDSQVADKLLASAMQGLEDARSEARRKQLYLERLVQPNTPDVAIEPKRIRSILTTLILGLFTWGALSLLVASVREHHD